MNILRRLSNMTATISVLALLLLVLPLEGSFDATSGQETVESNVVYGMYSGLALLMDVHRPVRASGRAILFVPGSGWASSPDPGTPPLKNAPEQLRLFVAPLVAAGYTVFVIDTRVAPEFHYPAPVEDASRAVRFIRYRASQYKIDAARVAAVGYSSGANLATMLGVIPDSVAASTHDSVDAYSARVQCVVGIGTPADLTSATTPAGYQVLSAYLGMPITSQNEKDPTVRHLLLEASPISYVNSHDAAMLFLHGTADTLVPIANVERMAAALSDAGVRTQLVKIPNASHWPLEVPGAPNIGKVVANWLDTCLTGTDSSERSLPN
jgi:acetyl esterase/lipase